MIESKKKTKQKAKEEIHPIPNSQISLVDFRKPITI